MAHVGGRPDTPSAVAGSPRRDDDGRAVIADPLGMIKITELTKRYGDTLAVNGLSFTVRPGVVTGFLGPNGAGKSTTMRMVLGLDSPSSGTATVDGRHVRDHAAPLTKIGALLEARAVHPKRSGRDHLRWLATTNGIPQSRVERGPRTGRPRRGRSPGGRGFLAGNGPAARHRRGAARRSGDHYARRAGQRARPGGDRLDPRAPAGIRARGARRPRVLPIS